MGVGLKIIVHYPNTPEKKDRDGNIDVSLLYKVAKEFIYYVKNLEEV